MPSLPTLSLPSGRRSPLIQTVIQACLINIVANILAQVIEYQKVQKALLSASASSTSLEHVAAADVIVAAGAHGGFLGGDHGMLSAWGKGHGGFEIDKLRVVQFVIWTIISVPPNFRWQQALERRFPAFYEEEGGKVAGEGKEKGLPMLEVEEQTVKPRKRNFKNTILKILCDQGLMAPINCSSFLIVITLLKGGSMADAILTLRHKFWRLKFAGWRLWPLVGLVNFTFVPVDRRIIVLTIVGLCWNVFLALFIS